MTFTVAIDGPAAAGKGTIATAVARIFGFEHLDTGLLYRAVGARSLLGEDPVEAARNLVTEDLTRQDLRTPDIAKAASKIATLADVRSALVDFQRAFARRAGGAVLDGRDIGTMICPEAEVKIFVTASIAARANRRFEELLAKGHETSYDEVAAEVKARDDRDATRDIAPLRPAEDAILLDTSDLTVEEAIARAVEIIETARSSV